MAIARTLYGKSGEEARTGAAYCVLNVFLVAAVWWLSQHFLAHCIISDQRCLDSSRASKHAREGALLVENFTSE